MRTRARTRDDAELRREKIIAEALRIVSQRGYHGFTIQELAARCGLSNAGLLYHFPSKDQLFVAVIHELEQREIHALGPLVALIERNGCNDVPLAAVIDLLHALFAHENALPELAQLYTVLQAESLDAAHPAHESFRAREASVLDLFTRLIGPYVVDPRSTARQMLALREGLRLQWLRADRSFDPLAEWIRAVTVLVPKLAPLREKHGLGPDEKAQPGPARRGLERRPKGRPIKTIHR
jgi:AcrR family transcriptional regulator